MHDGELVAEDAGDSSRMSFAFSYTLRRAIEMISTTRARFWRFGRTCQRAARLPAAEGTDVLRRGGLASSALSSRTYVMTYARMLR